MRVLHADDWFWVTDGGPVATFNARVWDPAPELNEQVIIDGGLFTITGIEQFAISSMGKPSYWERPRPCGLLLRDHTDLVWNDK